MEIFLFEWHLSQQQWVAHWVVFALNLFLLTFAKPIFGIFDVSSDGDGKVRLFRVFNILILLLHSLDLLLLGLSSEYEHYFVRLGLSLITFYLGLFFYCISCYFSRRKFGREKEIDNKPVFLETYSTRIVELILLVFISLTTILILIKLWGADTWLETTGIIGLLAAFLAFTSHVWAPDIISGLIILNTQMLEDGDVVIIDGYPDEYIINKVSFIYVTLLDVRKNHRTLMRNSRFIQTKIDNLNRVASSDGVRKTLTYKVSYPDFSDLGREDKQQSLLRFRTRIDSIFEGAYEQCLKDKEIKINDKRAFTWALTSAGDFALEFSLFVYLKRLPNTKVTSTVRKHLMGTVYKINEAVYVNAVLEGIDLSTPTLADIHLQGDILNTPKTE